MAEHSTLNWRIALCSIVAVVGLGATVSVHAGREITSSDSGLVATAPWWRILIGGSASGPVSAPPAQTASVK